MLIYGINPVLEALRAGRVTAVRVSPRADDRVRAALKRAEEQGVPVRRVQAVDLDRDARRSAPGGQATRAAARLPSRFAHAGRGRCSSCARTAQDPA